MVVTAELCELSTYRAQQFRHGEEVEPLNSPPGPAHVLVLVLVLDIFPRIDDTSLPRRHELVAGI